MALSAYNSDGSLIYGVGIDTTDLDIGVKHIEDTLENIITKAVNASKAQTNLFADILPKNIDTAAIDAVIAKIKQLQDEEKKLQDAIASTSDKDALAGYRSALDDIQKKLDVAPAELYKEVLAEVQKQMVDSANTVADNFQENTEKSISAVSRLRQLKNELTEKGPADPQFEALLEEATELEEKIKNVNKTLELSSNNVAGIAALKEAVKGLVGAFEAVSGAIGLFGGDSEAAKQATEGVIQAMGILNGIEEFGSAISKEGALNQYLLGLARKSTAASTVEQAAATEALTVVEGEQIAATEGAVAAQEALNATMAVNPAAVLILALGTLIGLVKIFIGETEDAAKAQALLNQSLEAGSKTNDDFVNAIKSSRDKNKAELEASNASAASIRQNDINSLQEQLEQTKSYEDSKAKLYEESANRLDELNKKSSLSSSDEEEVKALQKTLEDFDGIQRKRFALEDQLGMQQIENEAAGFKERLQNHAAYVNAAVLQTQEGSRQELVAQLAAIRANEEETLKSAAHLPGEIAQIKAQADREAQKVNQQIRLYDLNQAKESIAAQLLFAEQGSAEELQLKIDSLNKSAQIERDQANGNAAQIKLINAKLYKDVADTNRQYALDGQKAELEVAIAGINTRLATIEKGSEEELKLREQLVDKQADLDAVSTLASVNNVRLRTAKIQEIEAKSFEERKKLEDQFYDDQLKKTIQNIESSSTINNAPLQQTVNDPFATQFEKYQAQKDIFKNDLNAIDKEGIAIIANMIKNKGDQAALQAQLNALEAKAAVIRASIANSDKSYSVETLKDIAKYAGLTSTAFNNMASAIAPLNAGLADTLSVMGKLASDAQNLATGIATGNPAQIAAAGINTITDVIGFFAQSKASAIKAANELKSYQNSLIESEVAYNELLRKRAISQADINSLTIAELEARREMLNVQKSQAQADYDAILKQIQSQGQQVTGEHTQSYGGFLGIGTKTKVVQDLAGLSDTDYGNLEKLYTEGKLTAETKTWFESLQKVHDEMDAIGVSAKEALDVENQEATGTTASAITDMIVKGFADGKSAVSDFADDTESLIRGALLNALKYKALQAPIQALYDQFAADAESNGGLDLSEVKKFQDGIAAAIQNAQTMAQQLQQATGISLADQNSSASGNSLSGAIKGISQQTGDLLAGQFGGLRITNVQILEVANHQLNTLNKIEMNTAASMQILSDYYRKWDMSGIKVII